MQCILKTQIVYLHVQMKKVLIITYYWPPSGGSGVQRWLKFVKYFEEYGITPIVYTVDNPDYAIVDETLKSDIPFRCGGVKTAYLGTIQHC